MLTGVPQSATFLVILTGLFLLTPALTPPAALLHTVSATSPAPCPAAPTTRVRLPDSCPVCRDQRTVTDTISPHETIL